MSGRVPTSAPPTLFSSGLHDRRALVVDPNRKKLRAIERVLKSVIATVEVCETLESPPDDGDFDLIALTYDPLSPELRAQWTARFGGTSRTRLMLLSSGHLDSSHRALLDQRRLTHLLATGGSSRRARFLAPRCRPSHSPSERGSTSKAGVRFLAPPQRRAPNFLQHGDIGMQRVRFLAPPLQPQ